MKTIIATSYSNSNRVKIVFTDQRTISIILEWLVIFDLNYALILIYWCIKI